VCKGGAGGTGQAEWRSGGVSAKWVPVERAGRSGARVECRRSGRGWSGKSDGVVLGWSVGEWARLERKVGRSGPRGGVSAKWARVERVRRSGARVECRRSGCRWSGSGGVALGWSVGEVGAGGAESRAEWCSGGVSAKWARVATRSASGRRRVLAERDVGGVVACGIGAVEGAPGGIGAGGVGSANSVPVGRASVGVGGKAVGGVGACGADVGGVPWSGWAARLSVFCVPGCGKYRIR
jgi:hypothetical protein